MPNIMQDLGTKIGAEFKAHRLRIETVESTKVDKVSGKQLSTEDYSTTEKTKLAGLNNYTLPIASASTLGGVKAGANINIDANGVISSTGGSSSNTYTKYSFTTNGIQTSFNCDYTVGFVDVFVNGLKLASSDFVATNGTSVDFSNPLLNSAVLEIIAFGTFNVANTYTKAEVDAITGNIASILDTINGQVI